MTKEQMLAAITDAKSDFKTAIYGEDVRDAMCDIADVVSEAVSDQLIEVDAALTPDAESGQGADARTVGRYAMLCRGRIEYDSVNPLEKDLDDYTDVGFWYITNDAASHEGYLLHKPDGVTTGGHLIVFMRYGGNVVSQLYHTNGNELYLRRYLVSSWSGWEKSGTSKTAVMNAGSLTSSDDVDTLFAPGMWSVSSSGHPQHWPFDSVDPDTGIVTAGGGSGRLVVLGGSASSGSTYVQLAFCASGSKFMYRYRLSESWNSWKEVASTAAIDEVNAAAPSYRGDLAYTDDLDTFTSPGLWRLTGSSYPEVEGQRVYPAHWPFEQAVIGTLIVLGLSGSSTACRVQFAFNNNSAPRFAYRFGTTTGWRDWIEEVPNNAVEQIGTTYLGKTPYAAGMTNDADDLEEMIEVGQSYYRHRKDEEDGERVLQYGKVENGKINCSGFIRQVMKAIDFDHSIYVPTSNVISGSDDDDQDEPDEPDEPYSKELGNNTWAVMPERSFLPLYLSDVPYEYPRGSRFVQTASQLGNWMFNQGLRVIPAADWSNVEPGDIIFYAIRSASDPTKWKNNDNRFFNISHIGYIVDKIPAEDVPEGYMSGSLYEDGTAATYAERGTVYRGTAYDPETYTPPYVHISMEVGSIYEDEADIESETKTCVLRKFANVGWDYTALLEGAAAYDQTHAYTEGEYCKKDGMLYRCKVDHITGGAAWDADDWTNVTNTTLTTNNMNTVVLICRPDLGHMTSDLEARVAALEAALAQQA